MMMMMIKQASYKEAKYLTDTTEKSILECHYTYETHAHHRLISFQN